MFYYLLPPLDELSPLFNVFRYISFRSLMAMLTAFLFSLYLYPAFVAWLKKKQYGQSNIRADVPSQHLKKSGTPTMGGLMIIFSILFSLFLWSDGSNIILLGAVFVFVSFGLLGMADDVQKFIPNPKGQKDRTTAHRDRGLSGRSRLICGAIIALCSFVFIYYNADNSTALQLNLPFFKNMALPLGWLFLLVVVFVIVGSSNAVNLTDGLDGLAIGPILVVAGVFGVISYLSGNKNYAEYLQINHVANSGELAVFCAAIIGAGLGFLWFNAPPAMVFMGDTGSLALGGVLGYMALATKHEIVLGIAGFLFVVEALSVMLQVGYFKYSKIKYKAGRRIFLMAPLHHHYEKKGLAETHIVIRFWIIASICAVLALSTLKLR